MQSIIGTHDPGYAAATNSETTNPEFFMKSIINLIVFDEKKPITNERKKHVKLFLISQNYS